MVRYPKVGESERVPETGSLIGVKGDVVDVVTFTYDVKETIICFSETMV